MTMQSSSYDGMVMATPVADIEAIIFVKMLFLLTKMMAISVGKMRFWWLVCPLGNRCCHVHSIEGGLGQSHLNRTLGGFAA